MVPSLSLFLIITVIVTVRVVQVASMNHGVAFLVRSNRSRLRPGGWILGRRNHKVIHSRRIFLQTRLQAAEDYITNEEMASNTNDSSSCSDQRRQYSTVLGIDCVHVTVTLPGVGPVTILEATAESQDMLVDLALLEEDNILDNNLSLSTGDPYGAWFSHTKRYRYDLSSRKGAGKVQVVRHYWLRCQKYKSLSQSHMKYSTKSELPLIECVGPFSRLAR
jgi:hypothetical protein